MNIGIAIIVYNRLEHTKRMLNALVKADGFNLYDVYIFSDAPKESSIESVNELRNYVRKFVKKYPNMKIIEAKENMGCGRSVINAISTVLRKYDAVISIEDDIIVSRKYLEYTKILLEKYKDDMRVGEITGFKYPDLLFKIPFYYKYDIFFLNRTSSWGWATWRNRWTDVDWEVKDLEDFRNDLEKQKEFNKGGEDLSAMLLDEGEWDLRWAYHNFKKNRLTIYPVKSYIENIGIDGTGVHCAGDDEDIFRLENLNNELPSRFPNDVILNPVISNRFRIIYKKGIYGKIRGLKKRLYKIYKKIFKN